MITRIAGSWVSTANADNALATVTRTAPGNGLRHFITSISASFSAAVAGKLLVLKQGTTEIARWYVHNQLHIVFDSPIEIDPARAISVELAASGTATVIGAATVTGQTL